MPDKIQNNDFLVMGFSEMPDRMPANEILSGNRVGGEIDISPSSHTTVRTVRYTAVQST